MHDETQPAAPLQVSQWFNTEQPLRLDALRGRVVLLHAFQMLCPGCVSLGLPQAARLREIFSEQELVVIGVHTVFEHHAVMNAHALRVFIHEYGLGHPIGIDAPAPRGRVPLTMQAYGWQGTPSMALIDRQGRLRLNHFGHLDNLLAGAWVGRLLAEGQGPVAASIAAHPSSIDDCSGGACAAR